MALLLAAVRPVRWVFEVISDALTAKTISPSILHVFSHLGSIVLHPLFSLACLVGGAVLILWSIEDTPPAKSAVATATASSDSLTPALVPGERIFVSSAITPSDLRELANDKTSFEARNAVQPYIGKWMQISREVEDVSSPETWGQIVTFADDNRPFSLAKVHLFFDSTWEGHISMLRKGQAISAIGQIESIDRFAVRLRSCELVST
jgi:hypothetical protein